MRWDQRSRRVLQATLNLPNGTIFRAMLNTDDCKIAVRRMQLIVVLLVRDGRLPADGPAAKLYGRRPARGVAEVERLAALSPEDYAVERKPATARLGLSPPTLDKLCKQQRPELPNRERQRRHRAREQGLRIAKANSWFHRPPRGKGFYKNGRVMTARIQLGRSAATWSLKFRDDAARAAAVMNPVRVAWGHVHEAAKQELNWEIGTAEHTVAVAARVEACGRLARKIHAAGGPKELVAFVMTPPQPQAGTASPLPVAVSRKAKKQIDVEKCVDALTKLIKAKARMTIPEVIRWAKLNFGVPRRRCVEDEDCCLDQARKRANNLEWPPRGRPSE
jgi:hypothetical protein